MQQVMRAAVLHKPGDIRIENVLRPEVQPNQALVRVVACGVCGSDIPRVLTKGAHKLPLICGHEFSGRIESLGTGMDGWNIGDLVAVPPLIPCFKCAQCLIGEPSRCEDYDYFGSRRDGAYAEYVNVPAGNLLRVPEGIDPTAVALADPAAIALHAIEKTNLSLGQRVAVVGCGPIGLFAIQWARLMGATEILAVDISDCKIAMAKEAGATQGSTDSPSASRHGVLTSSSKRPEIRPLLTRRSNSSGPVDTPLYRNPDRRCVRCDEDFRTLPSAGDQPSRWLEFVFRTFPG